jgi:hypothetical protein
MARTIALSSLHKRAAASGAGSTLAPVREGTCTAQVPLVWTPLRSEQYETLKTGG